VLVQFPRNRGGCDEKNPLVSGSFRKGNTHQTLVPIREVFSAAPELEVREFLLKDMVVPRCFGCALCISKGKEFCPTFAEEKELQDNLEWCDALVVASPVYNGRETFIVKAFFDKFTHFVHRPCFFEKKAMVLVTRGGLFREAGKYISKTLRQWGFDVTVSCGEPELPVLREHLLPKVEGKLKRKAMAFVRSLEKGKPPAAFSRKIWFEVWKVNVSLGKAINPVDYDYWNSQGWLEASFYYPTRVNPFAKMLSVVLRPIMESQMRKTFKGY